VIKLVASLAQSKDYVDRAIAFGEAVPRLERMRVVMTFGFVVAVLILAIGYINMNQQISAIRAEQARAQEAREKIMIPMARALVQRDIELGKLRASQGSKH
jgi:hypothetical protein